MVLITTGKIVNSLSTSVRKIVKDLIGFNLGKEYQSNISNIKQYR